MYALPYHPMSWIEPKVLVMDGMAVAMMRRSKATRKKET